METGKTGADLIYYLITGEPLSFAVLVVVLLFFAAWIIRSILAGRIVTPWFHVKEAIKEEVIAEVKTSHVECPLYPDYLKLYRNAEFMATMPHLRLEDQKNMTYEVKDSIIAVMEAHYLSLLKEVRGQKDGIANDQEFLEYKKTIKNVMEIVQGKIFLFYQENHFAEMSELEFRERARQRKLQITNLFTSAMDEQYSPKMEIDRVKLYDHNMTILHKIEEMLDDMFLRARIISVKYQDKAEAMAKEVSHGAIPEPIS
jgi:hypothetical protein